MGSKVFSRCVFTVLLNATLLCASASAETYRWKDSAGELHYGSAVPSQYANQPYDIISESGLVIGHVDPAAQNPELVAAMEKEKAETAKALAARQAQSDRLLLIKYPTEEALLDAMEMEINQVGYDNRLIRTSYDNTNAAITDKVRLAADQQRSGMKVSKTQIADFDKLYRNLNIDRQKLAENGGREGEVRAEFSAVLQRYRDLVREYNEPGTAPGSNLNPSDNAEARPRDQS